MPLFGPPNVEKLEAKGNIKDLIKALQYRKASYVQLQAAEALGRIGDSQAVDPLITALKNEDIPLRIATVEALGRLGDPRSVKPLIDTLNDRRATVRKAALNALKKLAKQAKVDKSLRQSAIDAVKQVDADRLNMELGQCQTSNPDKAVKMLFDKAMAVVPTLSQKEFTEAYHLVSGDDVPFPLVEVPLVEGAENEVKSVILNNARVLAKRAHFREFSIHLYISDEEFRGREEALLMAWVGEKGLPVHLWKTKDAFYVFGCPEFLSSKGTTKEISKKTKEQKPAKRGSLKEEVKTLIMLLVEAYQWGDSHGFPLHSKYPQYKQIRSIGQRLYNEGGIRRMRRVFDAVNARKRLVGTRSKYLLGGSFLEWFWDRIGPWKA